MQSGNSGVNGLALLFHPLAMNSSRHWLRLLRASGGVDGGSRLRSASVNSNSLDAATLALLGGGGGGGSGYVPTNDVRYLSALTTNAGNGSINIGSNMSRRWKASRQDRKA